MGRAGSEMRTADATDGRLVRRRQEGICGGGGKCRWGWPVGRGSDGTAHRIVEGELSECAGGTIGSLTLFNTATSEELLAQRQVTSKTSMKEERCKLGMRGTQTEGGGGGERGACMGYWASGAQVPGTSTGLGLEEGSEEREPRSRRT